MHPTPGQNLGHYRIIERIGRGGMAAVYKAYQPSLDRYVAIKVLPAHLTDEPGFAERFRREARAVAKLEHPHILAVHDYGQEGDLTYIAMRYVEGGTLKDLLGKALALPLIVDLIGQIGEALDYAHEHGVIHRDVKPSNVLLDKGNWALLTDFGVARMVEATQQLTGTGAGVGTPAYMSPEQGQGKKVDRRSDVYSLGVVLYEMLTGKVPFEAETPLAVVWKHVNEPLPLPRTINPAIPEAVERVVLKALAKLPEDRFREAHEIWAALEAAGLVLVAGERALKDDQVVTEPAPNRRSRFMTWLRKPRRALLLKAALVGTAAALLLLTNASYKLTFRSSRSAPSAGPVDTSANLSQSLAAVPTITADVVIEHFPLGRGVITDVASSPDGQTLAVAGDQGIWLYELPDLKPRILMATEVGIVQSLAWSPDSRLVASGVGDSPGQGIVIWDASDGRFVRFMSAGDGPIRSLVWSSSGTAIASAGGLDGRVVIWDTESSLQLRAFDNLSPVRSIDFSRDGELLAVGSHNGQVRVWDLRTGNVVTSLRGIPSVSNLAFSPDDSMLAWVGINGLLISDLSSILTHVADDESSVTAMAWSPDSGLVATGHSEGGIQVWDADEATRLTILKGHSQAVQFIDWSRDGQSLVSASSDGTIRLWSIDSALPASEVLPMVPSESLNELRAPEIVQSPQAGGSTEAQRARACMVTDALSGGGAFHEMALQGLQESESTFGIESRFRVAAEPTDREASIGLFVNEGCDLIIGVGFLLDEVIVQEAAANPDVRFMILDVGAEQQLGNLRRAVFAVDEPSFLAGYLAAGVSRTGILGTFGGAHIRPVTDFMDGFSLGVEHYNAVHATEVQVIGWDPNLQSGYFTETFTDSAAGRAMGERLLAEGADILFPVAGSPSGFAAADVFMEAGNRYLIGVDTDWAVFFPEYSQVALTSVRKRYDLAVVESVRLVVEGNFTGGIQVGTLENGGVDLAPFHNLGSVLPETLRQELEQVRQDILTGAVQTLP